MSENAQVTKLEELLKRVEQNRIKLVAATAAPVELPSPSEPPPVAIPIAQPALAPESKPVTVPVPRPVAAPQPLPVAPVPIPRAIPKPVAFPEPVPVPVPVPVPEPMAAAKPVAVPEPVAAAKPVAVPEPVAAASIRKPEIQTFTATVEADGPVVTHEGEAAMDWTLRAVLGRAFKLGN